MKNSRDTRGILHPEDKYWNSKKTNQVDQNDSGEYRRNGPILTKPPTHSPNRRMIDRINLSVRAERTADEFELRLEKGFRGKPVLEFAMRLKPSFIEENGPFDNLRMQASLAIPMRERRQTPES